MTIDRAIEILDPEHRVYGERWDRVFKPVKKPDDFCSFGERRAQSADVRNMEGGNEHE